MGRSNLLKRIDFNILLVEYSKLSSKEDVLLDLFSLIEKQEILIEASGWSIKEFEEELLLYIDSGWTKQT
jgi:hypothetical protein